MNNLSVSHTEVMDPESATLLAHEAELLGSLAVHRTVIQNVDPSTGETTETEYQARRRGANERVVAQFNSLDNLTTFQNRIDEHRALQQVAATQSNPQANQKELIHP